MNLQINKIMILKGLEFLKLNPSYSGRDKTFIIDKVHNDVYAIEGLRKINSITNKYTKFKIIERQVT